MGSQISQSQQLRNTFPLSEYMMLPSDKNYPDLTFIQRLCDNAVFAACAIDKNKQNYQKSNEKHVIKRVQKRQIGKKVYELYEWATASVQGLVEYINLIDKNRKISKTQFKAIVQGSILGYNALSKESFQIECLYINMNNLRIFNQVQLKRNQDYQKQIVNTIKVKVMPKNMQKYFQKNKQNMKWKQVRQCIHQGGVLTQRQLLGEYLLQFSNDATKFDSKVRNQSLKNLKQNFGSKIHKVIEALLSNNDWKTVVKILNSQQIQSNQKNQKNNLKQITNANLKKIDATTITSITQKDFINDKKTQTQKTIDTNKNVSQKILFKCFKTQQNQKQQLQKNQIKKYPQLDLRNRISSYYQVKSVSPTKQTHYFSPPSIKVIQEAIQPKISKEAYNNEGSIFKSDGTKLARTNSILTIYPDVFREQNQIEQRNRILSTRNLRTQKQFFSPQQRIMPKKYPINSPKMSKNPQHDSYINHINYQKQIISNNQNKVIQKRKGKKIELKPSKPSIHLKTFMISDYLVKTKPDIIEGTKKKQQQELNLKGQSFLSQQFNGMQFSLQQRYFGLEDNKFANNLKRNNINIITNTSSKTKVQLKPPSINLNSNNSFRGLSPRLDKENSPYGRLDIRQANSQTILIQPQKKFHIPEIVTHTNNQSKPEHKPQFKSHQIYQKNSQIYQKPQQKKQQQIKKEQLPQEKLQQSKYIGPINIKGQKQGQGKLYFPSGGSYIGNFFKDFMHGSGKLYYPSGKIAYQGNFKYDKFHGAGKLYNQNPSYIQAFDFRNFNKIEVTQKQQPIHKQHFLINTIQKQKKISYWKYYQGQMNYDMKHGKGTLVLDNGQTFEGQFRDDLVNGMGVFYGQNGKISGRWEDNLLVEIYR